MHFKHPLLHQTHNDETRHLRNMHYIDFCGQKSTQMLGPVIGVNQYRMSSLVTEKLAVTYKQSTFGFLEKKTPTNLMSATPGTRTSSNKDHVSRTETTQKVNISYYRNTAVLIRIEHFTRTQKCVQYIYIYTLISYYQINILACVIIYMTGAPHNADGWTEIDG